MSTAITIIFPVSAIPATLQGYYGERIRALVRSLEEGERMRALVRLEGYAEEYEQHLIDIADVVVALCDYRSPEFDRSIEYALYKKNGGRGALVLGFEIDRDPKTSPHAHGHPLWSLYSVDRWEEIPLLLNERLALYLEELRRTPIKKSVIAGALDHCDMSKTPINLPVLGPAPVRRATESPFVTGANSRYK